MDDVLVKREPLETTTLGHAGPWDLGDWRMPAGHYHPGLVGALPRLPHADPYRPHPERLADRRLLPTPAIAPHAHAPPAPPLPGVSATLQNAELWRKFHDQGNEMIITKTGRRMFPSLRVRLSGLEPEAHYFVVLELRLAAPTRFKYSGGRWVAAGAADAQSPARVFVHPDSPATGAAWSTREVNFQRSNPQGAKLTNNVQDATGHNMVLASMHKYLPFVHVVRASDKMALHCSPTASFAFPETEFMAVTAYQNEVITRMKIDNNPFAKGFRETGMSRCRRKQQKMLMGAAEVLRETVSPSPSPSSTTQVSSSSSSHDDSGVSVSSIGSAPPSPPLSLPATPPPPPVGPQRQQRRLSKQLLSIDSILAKEFGPSARMASTVATASTTVPATRPHSVHSAVDSWVESSYHYSYPYLAQAHPWAYGPVGPVGMPLPYMHPTTLLGLPPPHTLRALADPYRDGVLVDLSVGEQRPKDLSTRRDTSKSV